MWLAWNSLFGKRLILGLGLTVCLSSLALAQDALSPAGADPISTPVAAPSDQIPTANEVTPAIPVQAPPPELSRPTVWGEPTEVKIGVFVIDVDEVNSADQTFAASVYYIAQWKNPFLEHPGPGPKISSLTEVWNPRLTIVGQQMAWKSYPDSVEIQPDGTVTLRQKVWGRFSQPLKLQDFPFDRQVLSIHLAAAGLSEEDVAITPLTFESGKTSSIADQFSLPDFQVISFEAAPKPYKPATIDEGVAGFELKMEVVRLTMYYLLKVIVPLCLIVIMSWLPRWISLDQAGTNIGISTSAFLTLVAYMFAITMLLPKVSYVTRMDRFILLSTLMVFLGLLHTVTDNFLLNRGYKRTAERLQTWSRVAYPVFLVGVLLLSFAL